MELTEAKLTASAARAANNIKIDQNIIQQGKGKQAEARREEEASLIEREAPCLSPQRFNRRCNQHIAFHSQHRGNQTTETRRTLIQTIS